MFLEIHSEQELMGNKLIRCTFLKDVPTRRIINYFVRASISYHLTSCLDGLDSPPLYYLLHLN